MHCPQCQAENPDQAKFCQECGAKLQIVCPQCGTVLAPQAKFCLECGCKIGAPSAPPPPAPPPSPPPATDTLVADALKRLVPKEFAERLLATRGKPYGEGERRMVTMLFSDVKGATAMGKHLDPEDVVDIMNGAFEVLIPPVYRHEGTLARLMGNAILAFFGAPLSHEDDAARAIRAGLEIVAGGGEYAERLERERGIKGFNVRVGINTGLVVVGEVGSDLRVEYTAMGDAINLAARMEQNAPAGGVLIAHDTYLQVRGLFEVEALEPISVKGKAEPVRAYAVQRARPRSFRLTSRGVEGVQTRMVGREGELKRLQDAFYLAAEDAECQVVTVVGDAGVGKTRLLWEFENWLDETCTGGSAPGVTHAIRHLHARAGSELQGVPYSLLRDLFVLRFDIQDSDPAASARAKLEAGIGQVLGQDSQGQMKAHLIGQLLGFDFSASQWVQAVGGDARQLRDRALMYVEEFLRTASVDRAVVALFEDIHWADDSSLDAISHLARALGRQRLLIVCLGRPALFDRRPHWGEGETFHTRIDLEPLSRRDSRQLVDEILQKMEGVPAALRDLVVAGSEGNPLYVEELIKVLIEQGVITRPGDGEGPSPWRVDEARLAELRVPPTLTGVLQARLDSLPLEQRAVLQQAAVVGYTFWDRVVARIGERGDAEVPELLSALRGRELVAQHETSAFAESREFVFKHAALREVAYESILKKVRRAYHSLVADWLIDQGAERSGEQTGLIAEHLELAGRTEEALTYVKLAGRQAAAHYANAEAVEYYTRALALLDQATPGSEGAERYELLLAREEVYCLLGRRAEQAADLAALAALVGRDGGPDEDEKAVALRRAEVARREARYHALVGDYSASLASSQEAVAWAERAADPVGMALGLLRSSWALERQGYFDQARGQAERALSLTREQGDRQAQANSLHRLGEVAYFQGDFQLAQDCLEQVLHIRRELGAPGDEARALNVLAFMLVDRGDFAAGRRLFERALAIYHAMGDRRGESLTLNNLATTYEHVGALAQARELYQQALALCRLMSDLYGEITALCNLGNITLHSGDPATARTRYEQALALSRRVGSRPGEGDSLTDLAGALAELGELDAAVASLEEGLRLRREMGQDGLVIDNLAGLADLAIRQGRTDAAVAYAREVLGWLAVHGADQVEYPVRAYVFAADALYASGGGEAERQEAAAAMAAARALVDEQAALMTDPDMRASFLQNIAINVRVMRETS